MLTGGIRGCYNSISMPHLTTSLGAAPPTSEAAEPTNSAIPLPSSSAIPTFRSQTSLTPVICDERAIARLLGTLLQKGGLSNHEAARRLGVTYNAVSQYLNGRRCKPSLLWFLRFCDLCGARVYLEFPTKR